MEVKLKHKSTEDIILSLIKFASNKEANAIDTSEVEKIAKLVKIKLSQDEVEYYAGELAMLKWVNKILSHLNTDNVLPMRYGGIVDTLHTRSDVVSCENTKDDILSCAQSEHGYFVVPKAISNE